ncbi:MULTISPECIES: hypothetical protein [unclassified Variovorax]|uniref:hypothetical protein n=1 Tax=unclassified Variovorax TaxID=663243 RepID=UPI0008388A29|nr:MULTISPECIES: hypothetical protein [unclassified Variovorax]PNG50383.1 hypothetical protein CHC06_06006 [Variovorax sp. B2]PNG51256.1 hypothetical protein CHC07_05912 [Variovorax sp. B4]VTU43101.1 hypothetical protein SRS16P1_00438 [Variovorax sp. SRS16]VTU43133.1 hypothetical protein E5P1_00435 [Variovorax sp. PBL-E5]VTU43446.1 hypothetical protein H6P1_00468 [Variovorax sp. PBL-H6]
MNIYPTRRQATGVARNFSKTARCVVVVYKTPENKYAAARSTEPVAGQIDIVFRDGYEVRSLLTLSGQAAAALRR